jgi:ATP-binding cassette subfamily F protein 3
VAILRLAAVRREIGTLVILDSVSGSIARGERVGLVGANGAGKTTLLRLAAGADGPDAGTVARARGRSVAMLAQEADLDERLVSAPTVRAAVRSGAAEVERLEQRLRELESAGAEAVSSAQYAELREHFDALDGYHLDQRVDEALSGLGFTRADADRPPTELSGGEQTRAALARLVVADPDLLLLDEPTNHLDVSAIEWLEQALVRRSGALLVASHDRAFLDTVVTRIWELGERRLENFRGAYSAYLVQREARDARLRLEAERQSQAMAREQELIGRFRSHRKFGTMHEHERRLEKLEAGRLTSPRRSARLALGGALLDGGPVRSGDLVVGIEEATIGFPPAPGASDAVPILTIPRLAAMRGDRIGVVGPNGAGKTTLLRTVAGELAPLDGIVRYGASVQPAYLAQVRGRRLHGATVLGALLGTVNVDEGPGRSYLARFLFRGEDVYKPVSELSGGERSRLELALIGIAPANLLLLDEPTNHLDIPAREALETFLRETPATLLVVSHDRRLLETVCERLWVVEEGRDGRPGRAVAFDGGYREWRAAVAAGWTVDGSLAAAGGRAAPVRPAGALLGRRPRRRAADGTARPSDGASRSKPEASSGAPASPAVGRAGQAPARLSKEAYRRQRSTIDADLTRLGVRKSQLELSLSEPRVQASFVELRRLSSELADVDAALAQAEDAWLALEERAPR